MRSKTVFIAVVALLCSGATANAQDAFTSYEAGRFGKPFKKLEKKYAKGDFEGLVETANQLRRKRLADSPEVDYLTALAEYQLAEHTTSATRRDQHLGKALRAWSRVLQKDPNQVLLREDQLFVQSLVYAVDVASLEHYRSGKFNKAKVMARSLAKATGDTVEVWFALFPPPVTEAIVAEPEPATPSIDQSGAANTRFMLPEQPADRKSLVSLAQSFEGTPYKWGGESPAGFDCSGFVLYVYRQFGYDFYHNTKEIAKIGRPVALDRARPGDIAYFGSQSTNGEARVVHVGIIVSGPEELQVVHSTNAGVRTDSLAAGSYWSGSLLFTRNVIQDEPLAGRAEGSRSMYGK